MSESIAELAKWLSLICTSISLIGCFYALTAAFLTRRFARRTVPSADRYESVTILKPLHGNEANLHANLLSFCRQIYPVPVQIVFGVQNPHDAAIPIVRSLISAFPDKDIELVVNASMHGSNRKVSNLINMSRVAKHEVIVLADSDMRVDPDYLLRISDSLSQPGVGLVTCLYHGDAANGFWSRLATMAIDFHFLPSVIVGLATGLANPSFGSTIALRRSTLDAIGGFEILSNRLADDYALGEAVRAHGLKIAIPPFLVAHTCPDDSFMRLFRHEIRWARTTNSIDTAGYIGSGVTHALPFALIAALLQGFDSFGMGLLVVALACRLYLQVEVTRSFRLLWSSLWLAPLRDLISFSVYIGCFVRSKVDWRGQSFIVKADGTLVPSATGQQRKVG